MKISYGGSAVRPKKSGNCSKKNSNTSSIIYKDIGDTILQEYNNLRRDRKKQSDPKNNKYRDSITISNDEHLSHKDSSKNSKGIKNTAANVYKNDQLYHQSKYGQRKSVRNINANKKSKEDISVPLKNSLINNYLQNECLQYPPATEQAQTLEALQQSFSLVSNVPNVTLATPKVEAGSKINKKYFEYKYIIGKGGFGKVWKVQHKKNRNQYAMKQMLKSLVMTKKSVQSVMNQKILLCNLNSPFIVNMHYAFQDRDTLYLVLDLLEGGDLRHHLSTKKFTEIQAKFFISCIILGLEYLHSNKIIHRDIKPENLVLDSRGYIRITDLGIARIKKTNNSSDTSGTPGYMSPEVICRKNHSYVSDYFAVGVIAYEMACQKRPYNGFSRNQIREKMLSKQVQLRFNELPEDWSPAALDFINRLLMRKQEQRLGYNGISQLKEHPWIRDLNWKKLATKQIQSPFIPLMKKSDFDQDEQITIEDEQEAELIQKNSLLLRKTQFQQLFKQYHFEPGHRKCDPASHQKNISNVTRKSTQQQRPSKETIQNINPYTGINNSTKKILPHTYSAHNTQKTPHSSTRKIHTNAGNRKQDRGSKETILNSTDYNETLNYEQYLQHKHKNAETRKERPFFKS